MNRTQRNMSLSKRILAITVVALTVTTIVSAFSPIAVPPFSKLHSHSHRPTAAASGTSLHLSNPEIPADDEQQRRLRQILAEETQNPETLKASAAALRNLQPADVDAMLKQMDDMPPSQRAQLESMGMNPELMRKTVEMMKNDPEMVSRMGKMMGEMTPQQILEKSRQAQDGFQAAGVTVPGVPTAVSTSTPSTEIDTEDSQSDAVPLPPPATLATLYQTAELLSTPPTRGVTLAGFRATPPVSLLVGSDPERDLSEDELRECWNEGGGLAGEGGRVDRDGFERVWAEVQEYFTLPMLDKGRERTLGKVAVTEKSTTETKSTVVATPTSPVSPEQLQAVKNLSDSDMDAMLSQMKDMPPEIRNRMESMGIDPEMMKRTAAMMDSNPLMKGAAKMMVQNMSPEQMEEAGRVARERMENMSEEERRVEMERLEREMGQ